MIASASLFRRLMCGVVIATTLAAHADVITTWNREMTNGNTSQLDVAPHLEVRTCALTHRAMLEAITETFRGQSRENAEHARTAAASSAAHHVLVELRPYGRARFDAVQAAQLDALPDTTAKAEGARRGREVAARLLRARAVDGWGEIVPQAPPAGPPLGIPPAKPSSPWPRLQPLALKKVDEVSVPYLYRHFLDGQLGVDERLSSSRLFDRIDSSAGPEEIRQLWLVRAAGAWNRIACELADRSQLELVERARLLAALNAGLADATVSAAHWQYVYGSWRACTNQALEELVAAVTAGEAPNRAELDAQSNLAPQTVLLPPLRNYPAADAALAGAAEAVLVAMLRGDKRAFSITASTSREGQPRVRSFASISAAARECAFAASLDGRHSREACVAGYELGLAVGRHAARRVAATR